LTILYIITSFRTHSFFHRCCPLHSINNTNAVFYIQQKQYKLVFINLCQVQIQFWFNNADNDRRQDSSFQEVCHHLMSYSHCAF